MTLIWSSHSHGLQGTANQKTASLKEGWLQAYPVEVESGVCVWATGRQEVDKTVLIWLIFSSVGIYSRHRFFWALLHFQSSHSWVCCGLEALIILKVLTTSIKSLCRTNPPSLLSPLPVLLLIDKWKYSWWETFLILLLLCRDIYIQGDLKRTLQSTTQILKPVDL